MALPAAKAQQHRAGKERQRGWAGLGWAVGADQAELVAWRRVPREYMVNVTTGDCVVDKLQMSRTGVIAVRKECMNSNLEAEMQVLMPQPQIFVERTLALIKPDVVDKEEEIEDLILRSGFLIVQKRKLQLSPEQCSNFYADQYGKVFFPNLTAYMSSGPLVAMVLARHCAVSYWKELLGPSNSVRARRTHPHSLRAIYGTDDLRNALHGSLNISSAEREIRFMFPEVILEPIPAGQRARDYLNLYVKPTLLAGLTALCKEKPADPMTWLADWLIEHNPNKPKLQHQTTEEEYQG
ncbi:nucleoside diphosphate kinase 5 [Grus japonensis]|uniref:Nucleoside diphosphate kinase homolog 5 n=2 Tax=Grus TaxID=9114 RepID=A0ABC9XFG1_GRUJA